MNKDLDFEIYQELDDQLMFRTDALHQSKVIHTRMLILFPETRTVYETIGRSLSKSEQFEKSIIYLKRITIINPRSAQAQINLANVFLKLERENECFSMMKKALSIFPDSSSLHGFLIKTLEERGKLQELGSFYQEIANMISDINSVQILHYESAENLVRHNKYPQALENYEKAVNITQTTRFNYHYQYAMALYHEGIFEEAIIQFENVLKLSPTHALSINNIAYIKYSLGRVQEALEEFEYIIEKELQTNSTYANMILVSYHLDKDEEVIKSYKDLLQPYIRAKGSLLRHIYNEALRLTQQILERHDLDEETREFNAKKLKGLNVLLPLLENSTDWDPYF